MTELSIFNSGEKKRGQVVFDLETQKSFDEVGGRGKMHELGVSLAVAYFYDEDKFVTYFEEDVQKLIDDLLQAERVIGFNQIGFDYAVLAGYSDPKLFEAIPSLDMMVELESQLGFRPNLSGLALGTFGIDKSADGLIALKWFREGKMDLIEKYCIDDVKITREIYEFGRDHGRLVFLNRYGRRQELTVEW